MHLKYIRCDFGFVLWPKCEEMAHSHMARALNGRKIISAGFAVIDAEEAHCFGRSESMDLDGKPEDSALLTEQVFGEPTVKKNPRM